MIDIEEIIKNNQAYSDEVHNKLTQVIRTASSGDEVMLVYYHLHLAFTAIEAAVEAQHAQEQGEKNVTH